MGLIDVLKMHSVEQMRELEKEKSRLMSNTVTLKRAGGGLSSAFNGGSNPRASIAAQTMAVINAGPMAHQEDSDSLSRMPSPDFTHKLIAAT